MRTILLLTITAIILLSGVVFATQASAQYQPGLGQGQYSGMSGHFQGRQGQFQGTSTPVNGTTYTNANFGVQVSIPSGWSGIEMKRTSGATTVTLAPGGFQSMQGGQRPPVTISLSMIPTGSTTNAPHFGQRNSQGGETCTNSTSTKTVNRLTFNEVILQCTGNVATESQNDKTQTSSAYITLGLRAVSTSDFDSQATTFETMLGTLQITTPSSTTVPPSVVIPTWVKKNAGYWATGTVGDSDFVSGVQYLIQQGIMKIPSSASTSITNSSSNTIPTWIKTNAGWWSTGQITDDDFVKGIQYLISSKIMKIS
jgi:hypothetical protein